MKTAKWLVATWVANTTSICSHAEFASANQFGGLLWNLYHLRQRYCASARTVSAVEIHKATAEAGLLAKGTVAGCHQNLAPSRFWSTDGRSAFRAVARVASLIAFRRRLMQEQPGAVFPQPKQIPLAFLNHVVTPLSSTYSGCCRKASTCFRHKDPEQKIAVPSRRCGHRGGWMCALVQGLYAKSGSCQSCAISYLRSTPSFATLRFHAMLFITIALVVTRQQQLIRYIGPCFAFMECSHYTSLHLRDLSWYWGEMMRHDVVYNSALQFNWL